MSRKLTPANDDVDEQLPARLGRGDVLELQHLRPAAPGDDDRAHVREPNVRRLPGGLPPLPPRAPERRVPRSARSRPWHVTDRRVSSPPRAAGRLPTLGGGMALRSRRGRDRRRDPRARMPDREAADDARPVPAVGERAAARVQPVDEPRPGRRLRRADVRDAIEALSHRGWMRLASGAGKPRGEVPAPARPKRCRSTTPSSSLLAVLMLRGPQTAAETPAAHRAAAPLRPGRGRRARSSGSTERELVARQPTGPVSVANGTRSCSARSSRGRAQEPPRTEDADSTSARQPARRRGRAPLGRARAIASA